MDHFQGIPISSAARETGTCIHSQAWVAIFLAVSAARLTSCVEEAAYKCQSGDMGRRDRYRCRRPQKLETWKGLRRPNEQVILIRISYFRPVAGAKANKELTCSRGCKIAGWLCIIGIVLRVSAPSMSRRPKIRTVKMRKILSTRRLQCLQDILHNVSI